MPRGGYRPGAGRPKKGSPPRARPAVVAKAKPEPIVDDPNRDETLEEARRLPLAYMLDVMNDPRTDAVRRDRMAIAAAPFMHSKILTARNQAQFDKPPAPGKKAQANADAVTAQAGTDWESLLTTGPVQ